MIQSYCSGPDSHIRTGEGGFEKRWDDLSQQGRMQDGNSQDGSYDRRSENPKTNSMKWLALPN